MVATTRSGLFGAIELAFADEDLAPGLTSVGPAGGPPALLPLHRARPMLYDRSRATETRSALWHQVVALARHDADRNGWPLAAVWLALPGLRRTVFRIARRFGADRDDVEADTVTAFLETLREIGPEEAEPGSVLLRTACTHAWNTARRALAEVSVENVEVVAAPRHGPGGLWQADFAGPERPDGLSAPLRVSVPADRVEGVRVGALAREWDLSDTVTDTGRLRRGRRVGALSLRNTGRRA
ncbi:PqqD family protein [Streptomyces sp. NPDC004732]|uniref:PqqD family protein n=1 Tax=Streptomyces sp. NPDC004732 TaxID=3154290 RepID=UPI0033AE9164